MHSSTVAAGSLLLSLMLAAAPLQAQHVSADVVFRGGPVAGRMMVSPGYSTYRRPVARRIVVVESFRGPHHRKHWLRRGYRVVTVYYVGGRYYDRWDGFDRRDVRRIVVYERDGRYYRDCDYHYDALDERYDDGRGSE